MLIGNKCDQKEKREVSYEEGLELGNYNFWFEKLNCTEFHSWRHQPRILWILIRVFSLLQETCT